MINIPENVSENGCVNVPVSVNIPVYALGKLDCSSTEKKIYLSLKHFDKEGKGRIHISTAVKHLLKVSPLSRSTLYHSLTLAKSPLGKTNPLWTLSKNGFLYLRGWKKLGIDTSSFEYVIRVEESLMWACLDSLIYMGIQYSKPLVNRAWISSYLGVDQRTTRRWCQKYRELVGVNPQVPQFARFIDLACGKERRKQLPNLLSGIFKENRALGFRISHGLCSVPRGTVLSTRPRFKTEIVSLKYDKQTEEYVGLRTGRGVCSYRIVE